MLHIRKPIFKYKNVACLRMLQCIPSHPSSQTHLYPESTMLHCPFLQGFDRQGFRPSGPIVDARMKEAAYIEIPQR